MTGGGAVVGVPMCVGGLALATNGVITFCNGTKNLVVVLYNWNDDKLTAEAAAPNQTPAATNPPQTSTQSAPPTSPPAAKPPPEPPPPAAKPAPKPGKPAAAPPEPEQPGPTLHLGKHYGSGKKTGPNSTTWVRCTGQVHHAISKEIHGALQNHKTLKDVYKARDNRFVTQAIDKAAHNGYETWHRNYERQVKKWLKDFPEATPAQFEAYLFDLYKTDQQLAPRFPNGL